MTIVGFGSAEDCTWYQLCILSADGLVHTATVVTRNDVLEKTGGPSMCC